MPSAKSLFDKETVFTQDAAAPRTCGSCAGSTMPVRCFVNPRPASGIEMNEKLLSDLSERLAAMAGANPGQDLARNMRALLASALTRLDLVSREEFDVQAQVLARAREKLAALEARVAELERARGPASS